MDNVVVIDFETEGIQARPAYPPKPVGVAIWDPPKEPVYWSWGHPQGNNCTRERAGDVLRDIWRSGRPLLFHNAPFDLDVAETHFGLPLPPWHMIHDTLYLIFLTDPHAPNLSLKPSSDRLLGLKPEEQDGLRQHLIAIGAVRKGQADWGAHICKGWGEIVGSYAKGDVYRTLRLFQTLMPKLDEGMRKAYDRERRLMPYLLENERHGIRVDMGALDKDEQTYSSELRAADDWLRQRLDSPVLNPDSGDEMADALRAAGVVTDFVKTPGGKDSVSKVNLTPDRFKDPEVASVFGYRNRLTTVLGTFIQPWLAMAHKNNGYIFTRWNQVRGEFGGARTGRMSCTPNFMNIPKAWDDKNDGYVAPAAFEPLPLMRKYILPDPGHLFLHRDYDQQEWRILAHYEDDVLCETYRNDPRPKAEGGPDMHAFMQAQIKAVTGLDLERRAVKILNFGLIYGMGLVKLAMGLTPGLRSEDLYLANGRINYAHPAIKLAIQVREAQRSAVPGLVGLEEEIQNRGKTNLPIRTWGGRLYYVEPPRITGGRKQTFEYKMLNYLIQGSGSDVTKEAIIRYHETQKDSRFLVTVHDEINISAPEGAWKEEMQILKEAMESVELDVPMLSDGEIGPSWGSLA